MADRREAVHSVAEFTAKAVVAGLLFGVLFGAANAYLGLKAGLTVSTSIPIAVLSAALFRSLGGGTILEANLAQTVGSASSSLASGTIFTIPALFMWGLAPPVTQVALLALFGGVLGILAMVPLRRLLIVQADAELPYPEGRACAEVLRATEGGAAGGRWIFLGLGLGAVVKLALTAAHLLPEEVGTGIDSLPNASLAIKVAPALLAVGFIVGFRAASVMVAGGLISAVVLIPLVTKVQSSAGAQVLSAGAVRSGFVVYMGAGAVAAAALVTIARTAPTMVRSLAAIVRGLRQGAGGPGGERTDRDLPAGALLTGVGLLVLALAAVPGLFGGNLSLGARVLAALGVAAFGFVFVPVSSRLVGLIGVSSNPTSAMALITMAGTSAAFLAFRWTGLDARAAVLTVGTVVCVAASKAGDISQDLKTGWMVGATPARQQFGQLIAAAVACWAVAAVVVAIGHGPEGFGEGGMPAPQARLMKTVVEAVLGATLPWDLLGMGGALALVGALAGLPALPFALGIYLPLSTMAAVFAGGLVRRIAEGKGGGGGVQTGILCASGYVAGEGLAGVLVAGYAFAMNLGRYDAPPATTLENFLALGVLGLAAAVLLRATRAGKGAAG
ncbi:MAG: oligopeptide transporter, OPT family [Planctomycetes bacterium]|nr:oligopeptide transporter, OPT family [Planctomycetota bacterium]